ncbi:MAG: hypothetical protein GEU28_06780 [Dehalococcoidia bacterium]|nr:hypothetical protein [Dehalococcoidia bacterium]
MNAEVMAIALAALAGVLTYSGQRLAEYEAARSREFAEALAAVQKWIEAPYRVRRRAPVDEARYALASKIADLQEEIRLHESWIRIESTHVAAVYSALVKAARNATREHLRTAWEAPPPATDRDMNLYNDAPKIDVSREIDAYVGAVRSRFGLWRRLRFLITCGLWRP